MMDILNLGAGRKPIANAVNHDRTLDPLRPWVTVAHDLNVTPWPWGDNTFDQIVALAVLEHLRLNLEESLAECWRILRPEGVVRLKLPYWNADASYQDVTHYWRFALGSFDQFDPDTPRGRAYAFYTPYKWKIVSPARFNNCRSSIFVTMQVRKPCETS
jgi:SAM-dependent methyltransferase